MMLFTDAKVQSVFAEYEVRAEDERQRQQSNNPAGRLNRDELLLPVGVEAGRFLHALILARRPKRILELGTSYGYSTLFLADAARCVGGKVITMELADYKQDFAREMLSKSGLLDYVEFRCGDAVEMTAAEDGTFDFAFLDIWKELYLPCFDVLYPKLAEEAVICADNMILPVGARPEVRKYRSAVSGKPDLQTALLPVGNGVELTIKWSVGNAKL